MKANITIGLEGCTFLQQKRYKESWDNDEGRAGVFNSVAEQSFMGVMTEPWWQPVISGVGT
jgi:hypothetical protein